MILKKDKMKLIQSVASTLLMLATAPSTYALPQESGTEKCYGVVKAGMNDCATANASCAGSASKDNQPDAFIFMPTGLCEKLVGGTLNSTEKQKNGGNS